MDVHEVIYALVQPYRGLSGGLAVSHNRCKLLEEALSPCIAPFVEAGIGKHVAQKYVVRSLPCPRELVPSPVCVIDVLSNEFRRKALRVTLGHIGENEVDRAVSCFRDYLVDLQKLSPVLSSNRQVPLHRYWTLSTRGVRRTQQQTRAPEADLFLGGHMHLVTLSRRGGDVTGTARPRPQIR